MLYTINYGHATDINRLSGTQDIPMNHDAIEVTPSYLLEVFDGFLIDIWGVLYDGKSAIASSAAFLAEIRKRGKPVVFLSNTSRDEAALSVLLDSIGIPTTHYDAIFSSGEATKRALKEHSPLLPKSLGKRFYLAGHPRNTEWLEEVPFCRVEDIAKADFVVAVNSMEQSEEDRLLNLMGGLRQPLLCANPDLSAYIDGHLEGMVGSFAKRYEALGGYVIYFGKPYPPIYAQCISELKERGSRRILAIGDSLRTDITGADRSGLESLFLSSTGVHINELAVSFGVVPPQERLEILFETYQVRPTFTLPSLELL